ncbi:hypothetical protein FKW77_007363 [Venturia effusa]|uniref:Cleft lip and palate transmembrane protein 1 n=1 Tax=Venturia effusa TaxID=50376 RepID=A0A517LN90_9PEZI|nr:hypothetical protein FKW77_007363 [Venturia effusa]
MPEAAAPAAQQDGNMSSTVKSVVQSVGIFIAIQFVMKQFIQQPAATVVDNADPAKGTAVPAIKTGPIPAWENRPTQWNPKTAYNPIPQSIAPIWEVDTPLDVQIYVSPSMMIPALSQMPKDSLVLDERGFVFGDWKDRREIDTTFPVPKEVQEGSPLWAHFLIAQSGNPLDPTTDRFDPSKAYHFTRPLTQVLPKKKERKRHNLLAGKSEMDPTLEEVAEDKKGPQFANYYHPNFTMSFIPDSGTQAYPSMHPALRQFVNLEQTGARDESGQNGWYYPILYVNTFWQLRNHMTELNSTVTELPLRITLNNMANWKFSIFASIDQGMKLNAQKAANGEKIPGGDGSEFEDFKRILLDSNSYLLGLTFFVSILHMIFELLAFKNDVAHWRKKKDNVGTSLRTIISNVVMQLIIFLYLFDNNENTSWMILFGQGMGIAIEAWKITKTVNVRIRQSPSSLIGYHITFEDKHQLSDVEKKTNEYDAIAFKYMYIVAVPLLLAYAGYSLVYESHKSWYSFIIATLVGSVYAYGFLMMVPSLYINYRLKSVAHMPGKAMMYKFLNTFIDDLFAFTIKMPMLHRLATLRDDVIFFIYLYQSYKYKVDYSRVNEFGQGGDEEDEAEAIKDAEVAKQKLIREVDKKAQRSQKAVEDAIRQATAEVDGVAEETKASGAKIMQGEGRKRK